MRTQPTLIEPLEPRTLLAAQLMADLNPISDGSAPTEITSGGDFAFFYSNLGLLGTDGTVANTRPVRLGADDESAVVPMGLTVEPFRGANRLLFVGSSGGVVSIYSTDGTTAGTVPLAVMGSSTLVRQPISLKAYADGSGAYLFSSHTDLASGRHNIVWRTDGTAAGTVQLVDFNAAVPPSPSVAAVSDGKLYFLVQSGQRWWLWKSDGTAAGTVPVADVSRLATTATDGDPRLVATDGKVYLKLQTAATPAAVHTLFASDGTAAGTHKVIDLGAGAGDFVGLGGRVYFRNSDAPSGAELWSSDGTVAGTGVVKDLIPGAGGSAPKNLAVVGEAIYFTAKSSASSTFDQLWKSDGTAGGTGLVANIPGTDGAGGFVRSAGKVFFYDDRRVWVTDGTGPGTLAVSDPLFFPVTGPQALEPLREGVLFHGIHEKYGDEVWYSDGTPAGTHVLDLTTPTRSSDPRGYVELNGRAYFFAAAYRPGVPMPFFGGTNALLTTDGTPGGTTIVRAGFEAGTPVVSGGRILFAAKNERTTEDFHLWASDGTAEGTGPVPNTPSYPYLLTDVDGTAFFIAPFGSGADYTLWRTDGTEGGTVEVSPRLTVSTHSTFSPLLAVGRTLYAVARGEGDAWYCVYRIDLDGGAAPVRLTDPDPAWPYLLGAGGGKVFVARAFGDGSKRHLWATDGTAAGTRQLSDLEVGGTEWDNELYVPHLAVSGGTLYIPVLRGSPDAGLWKSDGTPEGTVPVERRPEGVSDVSAVGGKVYYVTGWAMDDPSVELRVTDGTQPGTPLRRFTGVAKTFLGHAGRTFFFATDPAYGMELWGTDGTAAGTRLESDIPPGYSGGTVPDEAIVAGGMLLFNAWSPQYGTEPWRWVPSDAPPAAAVSGRFVFYNNSRFDGNDAAADARDDGAIATDKVALLPYVGNGGFDNLTSYGRGINGLMVDVANLPAGTGALTADDFRFDVLRNSATPRWVAAPAPQSVSLRRGAGGWYSDRVTITWADGAIRDAWLRVTVLPTARTGLGVSDSFVFGNLVGETGENNGNFVVNAIDLGLVRARQLSTNQPIDSRFDFNRDGRVNAVDLGLCRSNQLRSMVFLTQYDVAPESIEAAAPRRKERAGGELGDLLA